MKRLVLLLVLLVSLVSLLSSRQLVCPTCPPPKCPQAGPLLCECPPVCESLE